MFKPSHVRAQLSHLFVMKTQDSLIWILYSVFPQNYEYFVLISASVFKCGLGQVSRHRHSRERAIECRTLHAHSGCVSLTCAHIWYIRSSHVAHLWWIRYVPKLGASGRTSRRTWNGCDARGSSMGSLGHQVNLGAVGEALAAFR